MLMTAYICGPIIGDENYMQKFLDAEYAIKSCFGDEVAVINPAKIVKALSPEGIGYNEYIHILFSLMDLADTVFMLEGWEKNRRAKIEREYAELQLKQVIDMRDIF